MGQTNRDKLLESYFKAFGIPQEKRSDERVQREILRYLENAPTHSLDLFMESLGAVIKVLWFCIVDIFKCVGLTLRCLVAPFVIIWNTLKSMKTFLKERIFGFKHRGLIKSILQEQQ